MFSFLAAVCCILLSGQPALAERRIALVIGNGSYTTAPLPNPVNDASLMAATLEELGFTVSAHTDLDRRGLQRAVVDFGKLLEASEPDTVALIYYAGHGVQIDGENYLIPVDAEIRDPLDVKIEGVRASDVLDTLNRYDGGLNIVILDACRNNPFEGATRSGGGSGLARMDAPTGTLVAFSTAPGRVAEDGSGNNSPYTRALSRAMRIPGLQVEDVFKRVRIEVLERTANRQVPWESSSLTGDFYFSGPPAAGTPPAPLPAPLQPAPAPRQPLVSGDIGLAMADPLPAPSGLLFPDSLQRSAEVQPAGAAPIDGVWRLNVTDTRFRVERGRIYTVDGYLLLPVTSVSPGKVTAKDIVRDEPGVYSGYEATLDGPIRMTLRKDMTLGVAVDGAVVDYSGFMTLLAADDPAAFERELEKVRGR